MMDLKKDWWQSAKYAHGDLKVFHCGGCDAVHFVMLDDDGDAIAYHNVTPEFFKAMVEDINKHLSGEKIAKPQH